METSRNSKWLIKIGLVFLVISLGVYYLFYVLFHDSEFIYHHFLIDLGFLPIEVFLVATIFEKLMGRRERQARSDRMHMIIGSFFYEVGTELVRSFASYDSNAKIIGQNLAVHDSCSKADFTRIKQDLNQFSFEADTDALCFVELKGLLSRRRESLLRLMENDNLMESEHFSQLLMAIFHLSEELQLRPDLSNLKKGDSVHLGKDVERVYRLLIEEWIDYLYHLKDSAPYLFSLAVRTNPFDPEAQVEVE
jgi:hypothetical protein